MTIATGSVSKAQRRKPRAPKTVACLVCHEKFPRVTAEHLRSHGLSLRAYVTAYTPTTSPQASLSARRLPNSIPLPALLDPAARAALAERIGSDPDFIFRLADEVSDVLATGPIRDRIRMAIGATIDARVEMQARALAQLSRVYDELRSPWRLEQAEAGGPVPTKDLLLAVQALGAEVARGEDTIMRAGRLVLEEQRTRLSAGLSTVDAADRFRGAPEGVPLPPADSTPEEREDMRIMWTQLMGAFDRSQKRRIISAEARVLESSSTGGGSVGANPAVLAERALQTPSVDPSPVPPSSAAYDL